MFSSILSFRDRSLKCSHLEGSTAWIGAIAWRPWRCYLHHGHNQTWRVGCFIPHSLSPYPIGCMLVNLWNLYFLLSARFVYELLGKAGITLGNHIQIQELIDKVIAASISLDGKLQILTLVQEKETLVIMFDFYFSGEIQTRPWVISCGWILTSESTLPTRSKKTLSFYKSLFSCVEIEIV